MKGKKLLRAMIPGYLILISTVLVMTVLGSRTVTAFAEKAPVAGRVCVVIDPGHGGEDGGASSHSGILESQINLEISLRLEDLLHLLGYDTYMIRNTDISIYTKGETIAQKKVSDLKERVRIINETDDALLISIHQNFYPDSQYSGAQVFYDQKGEGETLAKLAQSNFWRTLNPGSTRQSKKATGIYLMEHIQCPGILVECGFLSNPEEEAKLLNADYQKQICCVLAASISNYLDG